MPTRIMLLPAVAIMVGPSLAYGSSACMTEGEARAKFPKAHLVWVGTNRCWTFGTVHVHSQPSLAAEPAPSTRPALTAEPMPFSRPKIDSGGTDATGAQCQYSPCE
jgi:hypothetical protein